ncbi:hypothetical protein [Oceanimonas baumannii]|uniref:Uncharacterized protein n=1 Tax=Oceanimonas baumannii TaxID=129578 RepID=A0A235C9Q0_9GAMM|nr:hypothetical protein [Oceanimonas baumannii]OYD21164.1 hypothetical protein B6S09_17280 [Oceanimonas baumannii]TDW54362.1 hypothetical protein LY04_03443 [Oceanimonas baumannii]
MNKFLACGVLALLLTGCGSTGPFSFDEIHMPKALEGSKHDDLVYWLELSHTIVQSTETERLNEIKRLQQSPAQDELLLALWLSHPKANLAQRQQAQQLFNKAVPGVNTRLQQFFTIHQLYNQELITFNRVITDRQQQINALSHKLNELATIDEQINERRYQGEEQ